MHCALSSLVDLIVVQDQIWAPLILFPIVEQPLKFYFWYDVKITFFKRVETIRAKDIDETYGCYVALCNSSI